MRKLELNINNKNYTLMMNRESIKWLEANGFNAEEFNKKPITFYDLIWTSLFIANHKEVNSNLAIKLLETYQKSGKNVSLIISFAIEEYQSFMSCPNRYKYEKCGCTPFGGTPAPWRGGHRLCRACFFAKILYLCCYR